MKFTRRRGCPIIRVEQLNQLLILDCETGKLIWKSRSAEHFKGGYHSSEARARMWNTAHAGNPAFATVGTEGYLQGFILGKLYRASAVVFAMSRGSWPQLHIDHINGLVADNRPSNLREVTASENMRNRRVSSNSRTGHHGVSEHLGKFDAYITVDEKKRHIGRFHRIEDAISARKSAEKSADYHQNHGRSIA